MVTLKDKWYTKDDINKLEQMRRLERVEEAARVFVSLRINWSGEDVPGDVERLRIAWDELLAALSEEE